jgi:hypothetical protein
MQWKHWQEVLKNGFQECFQKLCECWQKVSLPEGTALKEMLCKWM